jgi:glycosyltransferase involved in cell wall biosynthesis
MRAVEKICERRPNCHVMVVGGDEVSYSQRLPPGQTYREQMLKEVKIDPARVHFVGKIPYAQYLRVLQVSSAHIYLTVPFVLSWSMLEAMSAGCVVIGSATPPVQEVIEDGTNGLLVDFLSPEQIADAVDKVLDDKKRMQAIGKAARKTIIKRYNLQAGIDGYRKLFEELGAMKK